VTQGKQRKRVPLPAQAHCPLVLPVASEVSTGLAKVRPPEGDPILVGGLPFLTTPQFHVLFILFSKCFSSFDHSTCSLSVLRRYLLQPYQGVHLTIGAAIPNSPTRAKRGSTKDSVSSCVNDPSKIRYTTVTLHRVPFQTTFGDGARGQTAGALYNAKTPPAKGDAASAVDLSPVHSPLLRASLLHSFPGLSDMLKFSPYFCTVQVKD